MKTLIYDVHPHGNTALQCVLSSGNAPTSSLSFPTTFGSFPVYVTVSSSRLTFSFLRKRLPLHSTVSFSEPNRLAGLQTRGADGKGMEGKRREGNHNYARSEKGITTYLKIFVRMPSKTPSGRSFGHEYDSDLFVGS
jgi:hypothetical protein